MFSRRIVSGVRRGRGRVLRHCGWLRLLLLLGGGGGRGLYRGGMSGRVGMWDIGGLVRLPGDLFGMLLYLLPHIEQPIRDGLQDDARDNKNRKFQTELMC